MQIGIVGCGNISGIYFENLCFRFPYVSVYACADLDEQRAHAAAARYGVPHVMTFEDMLACEAIDTIVNLTTPAGHYPLCKAALLAGKNVYVEKPFALTFAEGKELMAIACERGLYVGCAPDTFMGAGIQTCMDILQSGQIGRPVAGAAFMMCHGHESWHPAPEFYYDIGGGPLFDMGPYYLTALVRMLGRAKSVFAHGGKAYEQRTITSQPHYGQEIPVKVDTHNAGLIQFENGAIITLVTSFDVWAHGMPNIEIYGTKGSLKVPDPNGFGGAVQVWTTETHTWHDVPLVTPFDQNARGIGVSEMALAKAEGRQNAASGALGLHVLEIMEAFEKSARTGQMIELSTTPDPMPPLDWNAFKKEE